MARFLLFHGAMKRSLLWLVILAQPGWAAAQNTIADPEEKTRTELVELLRLAGDFWEPAGAAGETLSDKLVEPHRLIPETGGIVSGSGWGLGVRQRLVVNPRSELSWNAILTYKGYRELGLLYRRKPGGGDRVDWTIEARHRSLADERFHGLGLSTSPGARTDYSLSDATFRSVLGVQLLERLRLAVSADLRRLEAGFDEEGVFAAGAFAPHDRSFLYASAALGVARDTRDEPDYARKGSLAAIELRRFVGSGSSAPGFQRISVELQKVVPLPGADHVVAARFRGDATSHASGASLPFFVSRGLGGSHSLRSYSLNRFRGFDRVLATVEYRHAVVADRLDVVGFWDSGGVYESFGDLELDRLRHSVGAGVRILRDGGVLLRLEIAHGAEGPRFLASFSAPF